MMIGVLVILGGAAVGYFLWAAAEAGSRMKDDE